MGSFFRKINLSNDWKILRMERGVPGAGCQPRNVINVINFLTVSDFSGKVMTGYSCLNPFQSLSVTLATQNWQQQVRQWCFWHGILRNELVIFASGWPRAARCWRIIYNPRSKSPVCFWSKKPSRPEPVSIPIPVKLGSFHGFLDKSEALTESSDQSEAQHPDGLTAISASNPSFVSTSKTDKRKCAVIWIKSLWT